MVFIIPNYILTIKYNCKNMIWCKKLVKVLEMMISISPLIVPMVFGKMVFFSSFLVKIGG